MSRHRLQAVEATARALEPSSDAFEGMCEAASDYISAMLGQLNDPDHPLPPFRWFEPEAAFNADCDAFRKFPEKSADDDVGSLDSKANAKAATAKLIETLDTHVVKQGASFTSPSQFGWVSGGGVPAASLGDLIAAVTNRFSGFFPAQPGLALIEIQLTEWFCDAVGFVPPGAADARARCGSFLASGSSMATIAALVCARDAHGIVMGSERWRKAVVYHSSQTHSSFRKGVHIVGCGRCIIREVPVDDDYRMSVGALKEMIAADKAAGLYCWLLCGTAGTTNTGAVDPLTELAEIAAAEGMWYHIDGAYGGLFSLCESGRRCLNGDTAIVGPPPPVPAPASASASAPVHAFLRADSLCIDCHKTLFLPFGCAVVLVRSKEQLFKSHANSGAAYLQKFGSTDNAKAPAVVHSADLGLELTKHNRSFRLWIPLALFGVKPFRDALEEKLLLARYCQERLLRLELPQGLRVEVIPPQLSCVVFRIKGGEAAADNDDNNSNTLTSRLEIQLTKRGRVFCSPTTLRGETKWLRACILTHRAHRAHVDQLLAEIVECVKVCGV